MTCQINGRGPTIAIGLGASSAAPLRMRMPYPPQNRTTFTLLCLSLPIRRQPRRKWVYTSKSVADRVRLLSAGLVNHLQARDCEDQPAAPFLHIGQLGNQFVPEVP